MKIHIAHSQDNKQGGGWSWIANATKAFGDKISSYAEADIYLIPSPSICSHEEVDQAKRDGKKIVLRVDNIVRNSRNRNTGMSRMKSFADAADLVVYQSEFARTMLKPFLGKDGVVILNSVDTDIFNGEGRREETTARYIYSRVNRDETKNWEMARFTYQQEHQKKRDTFFHIVGQFSSELIEYNFDFYQGEPYKFWGVIPDPLAMATLYRDSDYLIYTFWNDACSNTLIEALCCGCNIVDYFGMRYTGGSEEIIHNWEDHGGIEYFGLKRMAREYLTAIGAIL